MAFERACELGSFAAELGRKAMIWKAQGKLINCVDGCELFRDEDIENSLGSPSRTGAEKMCRKLEMVLREICC